MISLFSNNNHDDDNNENKETRTETLFQHYQFVLKKTLIFHSTGFLFLIEMIFQRKICQIQLNNDKIKIQNINNEEEEDSSTSSVGRDENMKMMTRQRRRV